MAFERIKRFFGGDKDDEPWRSPAEATMSPDEKVFAEERLEDQAADRAAAEHLGGVDPSPSPDRDDI